MFLYLVSPLPLASQTTVGWPAVIGYLSKERTQAETCVGVIKSGGDKVAIDRAKQTYIMGQAEMDGVIAGLMTAAIQGGNPDSLLGLRESLEAAGKGLQEICNAAIKGGGSGDAVFGEIVKAAQEPATGAISAGIGGLWAQHVEKDALVLETVKIALGAARWPTFDDITTLLDEGSRNVTDLYDRPVLAVDPGMHTGKIWAQAVDAAGRYAVTGGDDRTVRIWSVADGKLLRTIWIPVGPERVGVIYAVAISPDGLTIAAGGSTETMQGDTAIYLFDRESGTLIRRVRGSLPSVVLFLKFSPDGRYLAATLLGGKGLRVFDRESDWSEVFRDEQYGDDSYGAAFAQDGRLATTALDGMIRVYRYDSKEGAPDFRRVGAEIKAASGALPYGLAFSPDAKRLAVGYADEAAVDILDGMTLRRVGGRRPVDATPTPAGTEVVAWSGDTLLAAGGARDAQGRPLLFAWDRDGLGNERRMAYCAPASASGIDVLPDGRILVSTAQPCLGLLDAVGQPIWTHASPPILDFRGQSDVMRVSQDGKVVDFGVRGSEGLFLRFDLRSLRLSSPPPNDGLTFAPSRQGVSIVDWQDGSRPTLRGSALPLEPYEISESLAVSPDAKRFFLGSTLALTAFDDAGMQKWRWRNRHEIWAVNASKDGRVVVTADGGGAIRWRRADDGRELLVLQVFRKPSAPSEWDWVLSTPEGFYETTPGDEDVLKWVVNHGPDNAATTLPITAIPKLHRPDALPHVLDKLETAAALGIAEITQARLDVQGATGSARPPGGVLHVLAIGIDQFGDKAGSLHLDYAAEDAHDVAAALLESQKGGPGKASLYANVEVTFLRDEDADGAAILNALDAVAQSMAKNGSGQDVAAIFFSGHGEIIDGQFYLIPYGFDVKSKNRAAATAVSASELAKKVGAIAAYGKVLLLLDAAHSGAIGAQGWAANPDNKILRDTVDLENVTVLTSSRKNEVSVELPEWKHGAFAEAFLDALKGAGADSQGVIRLSALTDTMENELLSLTKGRQHLGMHVNFSGDLFVAGHY